MRFFVEVPAVFQLEIIAESSKQAASLGEAEVFRLNDLMSLLARRDSPDHCISFYSDFPGKIFVRQEKPGSPSSDG